MEGKNQTAGEAVRISVQLSVGGAAFGIAMGIIATLWLRFMFGNTQAEITLTVRLLQHALARASMTHDNKPGFDGCRHSRTWRVPNTGFAGQPATRRPPWQHTVVINNVDC